MRKERAEGGKVGQLQQKTCAARVSNERGGGDGTKSLIGQGLRRCRLCGAGLTGAGGRSRSERSRLKGLGKRDGWEGSGGKGS